MALTRFTAEIENDLTLRAEFRRDADTESKGLSSVLFDPFSVDQVEILDTDNATVLETIATADITKISTGIYEVTADKASYDVAGTYYDKWTWVEDQGDADTLTTMSVVVKDKTPAFLSRSNAALNEKIILYTEYRLAATDALYDPFSVDKVEILDIDGVTILETNNAPVKQAVGIYYIIADDASFDAAGTYQDKWYAVITDGDAQTSEAFDIVVGAGVGVGTGSYPVQIEVLDNSSNLGIPALDVIASGSDHVRLLTTTTDGVGKAYFNMNAGTYTFSVRDPLVPTKVFSENHKTLVVENTWDLVPGSANPNILSFSVTSFIPEWSAAAALAVTDLCAVTAKFADLEGNYLRGVVVRITNKFVPSIKSAYGIVGDNLRLVSDSAGEIAVSLVREAEVSVTIEGTGITRHVTIPDAAAQDLVALVGAGADVFTIAVDNTFTIPATAV